MGQNDYQAKWIHGNEVDIMSGKLSEKAKFFYGGGEKWRIPPNLPKEKAAEWVRQQELCSCVDCHDQECHFRNNNACFPKDAGGQDQCLRLMKTESRFVWRNGDGRIITIPPEIIEALRAEILSGRDHQNGK